MSEPADRIESAARAELAHVEQLLADHLAGEFHHRLRSCKKCASLACHKRRCEQQLKLVSAPAAEDVPLF